MFTKVLKVRQFCYKVLDIWCKSWYNGVKHEKGVFVTMSKRKKQNTVAISTSDEPVYGIPGLSRAGTPCLGSNKFQTTGGVASVEVPSLESLDVPAFISGLSTPEGQKKFQEDMAEIQAEDEALVERCKAEHGGTWEQEYMRRKGYDSGYDTDAKLVNESMYEGHMPYVCGLDAARLWRFAYDRMALLLGCTTEEACWNWFREHGPRDSSMAEALVADAVKTGRWKELPDCLQDEYRRRIGGTRNDGT